MEVLLITFVNANRPNLTDVSLAATIHGQVFDGNQEAYGTKKNTLLTPVIGRFIRLHPIQWNNKATVRMEFYGCELDGKILL